jgi:Ser/Thr protein kinase RdoA (MazF antagonist)
MDDVDRGRRGRRAAPTAALLRTVQDRYGLGPFGAWRDLGGSSSLNLLAGEAHGDPRYVVRVHRPSLSPERLAAIQRARAALLAGGVPCAPLVRTADGRPWISVGDRLVEVERHVAHDAVMDRWDRLAVGMALLGRAHTLLRHVDVGDQGRRPPFANHVEPADVAAWTRRGVDRIRGWGPTAEEAGLAAAAEALAAEVSEAEAGLAARLPRQLVHGDFWDDNVGFRHGRVVLLTDFDFMGERARIDDLALTLYFASSDLGPFAGPADHRSRLASLVARYDAAVDPPLSAAERAALPVAVARQPLWSVGGWVARLDDLAAARRHAASVGPAVRASLRIMADLPRWRDALA